MGALECDRKGCEHIMCGLISINSRYYICGDCHKELLEIYPDTISMSELKEFMETPAEITRRLKTKDVFRETEL